MSGETPEQLCMHPIKVVMPRFALRKAQLCYHVLRVRGGKTPARLCMHPIKVLMPKFVLRKGPVMLSCLRVEGGDPSTALHAPRKGGDAQVCTLEGPVMLSCLRGERGETPARLCMHPVKVVMPRFECTQVCYHVICLKMFSVS